MVQIPEPCAADGTAGRAGFRDICAIGRERIRRAGRQLREDHPELDTGFRVMRHSETNYTQVKLPAAEYRQERLASMITSIRSDRTAADLLLDCLLRWGVDLSLSWQQLQLEGKNVIDYGEGAVLACLETGITADLIRAMAESKPQRMVFRDDGFADSAAKINAAELIRHYAPDTLMRVL